MKPTLQVTGFAVHMDEHPRALDLPNRTERIMELIGSYQPG